MHTTLAELAALVDGLLVGDGGLQIHGAATIRDAQPRDVTLIDTEEKSRDLANCPAAAAIAPKTFLPEGLPVIQVDDVHRAFSAIVRHFHPERITRRGGVSPMAVVSPTATIGNDVEVHPLATIGDDAIIGDGATIHSGARVMAGCRIGAGTTLFPNAVLYENTVVGPRCLIHAGAIIGAYGFGYETTGGRHELSAQLGNVVLGADVEVGAGTTIDRGTYGSTEIGEGTKIDDQVMIAHNCRIGRHNMLCSQVGIAGSTSTGDYVVMAGQAGIRDHVHIGKGAVLGAMSGIMNDVPDGARMIGIPATPQREQMLKQAAWSKLPEMRQQMKMLQKTVDALDRESKSRRSADAADANNAATTNGEPAALPDRRAVA